MELGSYIFDGFNFDIVWHQDYFIRKGRMDDEFSIFYNLQQVIGILKIHVKIQTT